MKSILNITMSILFLSTTTLFSKDLIKTTTTWEGEKISYPKGQAKITSQKLSIKEGEVTKFHCHPVPTFGYILKGKVEVETKDGKTITFSEGESAVEVLRTVHRGKAVDGPVEIIVFYAGSSSMPNTVLPENDKNNTYCNE